MATEQKHALYSELEFSNCSELDEIWPEGGTEYSQQNCNVKTKMY